jgi:hypothetical protein
LASQAQVCFLEIVPPVKNTLRYMANECRWLRQEGKIALSAGQRPLSADAAQFAGNGYRSWPDFQHLEFG